MHPNKLFHLKSSFSGVAEVQTESSTVRTKRDLVAESNSLLWPDQKNLFSVSFQINVKILTQVGRY